MISPRSSRRPRWALTLVELLIVVSIVTLLAAVTLPSVKTILQDRKTNQTAIVLRSVFEAAKAKAAGRNRNVAVVIERMDDSLDGNDANAAYIHRNSSVKVSLAEVLPPFRGDLDGAKATLTNALSYPGTLSPALMNSSLINHAIFDNGSNPSLSLFAQKGAFIAFGDRSERFEILESVQSGVNLHLIFANQPATPGSGVFGTTPSRTNVQMVPGEYSFRIYSRPRRLFNKPVDLPRGTCIDLSLSGLGPEGAQFASDLIDPAAVGIVGTDVTARYFKPIYIVFGPDGSLVEILMNGGASATTPMRMPSMVRGTLMTPTVLDPNYLSKAIYLFIGRSDQVANPRIALPTDFVPNIRDSSGYWLKIVPDTGQISATPSLDPIEGGAPVGSQLTYSRRNAIFGNDLSGR